MAIYAARGAGEGQEQEQEQAIGLPVCLLAKSSLGSYLCHCVCKLRQPTIVNVCCAIKRAGKCFHFALPFCHFYIISFAFPPSGWRQAATNCQYTYQYATRNWFNVNQQTERDTRAKERESQGDGNVARISSAYRAYSHPSVWAEKKRVYKYENCKIFTQV